MLKSLLQFQTMEMFKLNFKNLDFIDFIFQNFL